MAVAWRNMSVPYTEEELEELTAGFKTLSSYQPENGEGGSISTDEVAEFMKLMRLESTPEQKEVYVGYWVKHFGERIPLGPALKYLKNIHKNEQFLGEMVQQLDKDGNGYISESEFEDVLKTITTYDSSLQGYQISFEDFVKEADTSQDGKVNLDECTKWFINKVNP